METKLIFKILLILLLLALFLSVALLFVLKAINEKKFRAICELYISEYGELPLATQVLKNSDWLSIPVWNYMKKDFFLSPLFKGRKSKFSNNEMDIDFAKRLPPSLTRTFYVERIVSRVGLSFFILATVVVLIVRKVYHL
ncbi:hypothetical protein Entas_1080 [Enterobacter soli]|uniref:hypothetical protein n=1 Tax=Enterobacter soli TaxID=885040 RepID=UPI000223C68A|nr:hypothetical protein [Enterobacter soli]AEN63827.1 hypothetical protein Entas_1080 [Enterobacter soli]OAT39192.1 hypothetical protein M987_02252 [Enterobacter soli ATCC BAA-2102]